MNYKGHKEHKENFTVSNDSALFLLRHCEERLGGGIKTNKVATVSISNQRRGNLPSLIDPKEFPQSLKNSLLQSQSEEIASRIQQHKPNLFFIHHIRRLAMTSVRFATSVVQEARFL
jgi:hypothetical protein